MRLFPDAPGPRLFSLPPGADYAAEFAAGLAERLAGAPPEAVLGVTVHVNTRRALRAIEEAFAALPGPGGAAFLPRMSVLGDLADEPVGRTADGAPLPPAVDDLRRQLVLVRLVERYLDGGRGRAPVAAAADLAATLAALIDEFDEEGVALDRLADAVDPEMARHWEEALVFAGIVRREWPAIRTAMFDGALDPADRQRRAVAALIARWQAAPPEGPVIVAGSTGSRAVTAELMAAVARLPQGALVLPGFDPGDDPAIWREAGPDHPLGPFRRLFDRLGADPEAVQPWRTSAPSPRRRLLAEALRPAPVTDAWVAATSRLASEAGEATAGLTLLEAASPREEAAAIALAIREGLERPGLRVALVTPDATLARRVTAELERFGVLPDDSLGRPLAQSPAGVFLRLIAEAASPEPDVVQIAALLGHPLCRAGLARGAHLRHARDYELEVLRQTAPFGLAPGRLPAWPPARPGREDRAGARDAWLAGIEAALAPLAAAFASGASLAALVAAHRDAAGALSAAPEEPPLAWSGDDGARVAGLLDRLAGAADAHGPEPMARAAYLALLSQLLSAETIRPGAALPHPRVAIWGTLEARVQGADLVILGGLNEGTWPKVPEPDPWLSRVMRARLGLGLPERRVGLAAHDFLQAAARPEAILSRARKVDGAPTVPARWLVRLANLLGGVDKASLDAMRARGARLTALVPHLHRPAPDAAAPPAERPNPMPPVEARPRGLSVTEIERLIRDPYAVYARKVLRLDALDPLGRAPDARDRGSVLHSALERFVAERPPGDPVPEEEAERLVRIAREVLEAEVAWPDLRRTWLGRIRRAAPFFAAWEVEVRADARRHLVECRGRMTLDLPAGPFEIRARADRIDELTDGTARIYDYKTGRPPGQGQIGLFSHQLHCQALILADGGFEGVPALAPSGGAYVGLTGSGTDGGHVQPAPETFADDLPEYRDRLTALLAAYDAPARGYLSRARIERQDEEGEHDHLARRQEWEGRGDLGAGAGEEGDG